MLLAPSWRCEGITWHARDLRDLFDVGMVYVLTASTQAVALDFARECGT